MKIYLAAPYATRPQVKARATELTRIGYTVTSRWLNEKHAVNDATVGAAPALTDQQAAGAAAGDLIDIKSADLLVVFTPRALGYPRDCGNSGGRHVETGYALALGKPVLLVGDPENIFHRCGSKVDVVPDWHQALIELAARLVENRRRRTVVEGGASE